MVLEVNKVIEEKDNQSSLSPTHPPIKESVITIYNCPETRIRNVTYQLVSNPSLFLSDQQGEIISSHFSLLMCIFSADLSKIN